MLMKLNFFQKNYFIENISELESEMNSKKYKSNFIPNYAQIFDLYVNLCTTNTTYM